MNRVRYFFSEGGFMATSLLTAIRERALDPTRYRDSGAEWRRPVRAIPDEVGVQAVESELGVRFPELLRAVYTTIGNGGFGPGYGLLPLTPLKAEPAQDSVLGLYQVFSGADPEERSWVWTRQLVPFCDWGCAIRSCVDCSTDAGAVVTFDPDSHQEGADWRDSFASTHASLEAWFSDWVTGVKIWDLMFEPDPSRARSGINPFTLQPMEFVPMRIKR
jgi:SMI1 / KNR4 family (SUKH-1)